MSIHSLKLKAEEYIPEWVPFTILPHIVLVVLLAASLVRHQHQKNARIAFHGIFGLFLLVAPSAILAAKVTRPLDVAHLFLLRFLGPFQIGAAYYAWKTRYSYRLESHVSLAKVLAAGLICSQEFFSYYSVSPNERGVHLAGPWFLFAFALDLSWFAVELYEFVEIVRRATNPDEIDVLINLTTRLTNNRTRVQLKYLFWADAVVSLLYSVTSIPSSDFIYKNVIEHVIQLDSLHRLITAEFGYLALCTAVVSLLAAQFSVYHQKTYVEQRIITQAIIAALHVYGSYAIYPFAQFFPHYIAIASFVPLYFIKQEVDKIGVLPDELPDENGNVSIGARVRTKYTKQT
ncbi:hypothetical protein M3Y96_00257000 [Aphelenchoides besseyi]|nr:hypothetical protein M3Y96_00257000 [Aphelenchoides besseyi]